MEVFNVNFQKYWSTRKVIWTHIAKALTAFINILQIATPSIYDKPLTYEAVVWKHG